MRNGWIFGAALALAGLAAQAIAGEALTTRRMEALPKPRAERQVLGDLTSVLKPITPLDSGSRGQLQGAMMRTSPYGTDIAGVCRMDVIWLDYAAIEGEEPGENARLAPYGVTASSMFRVSGQPSVERYRKKQVWRSDCARLDPEDDAWFPAPNAFQAAQSVLALEQAVAAVKAGTLRPAPCEGDLLDRRQTCAEAILQIGIRKNIGKVDACSQGFAEFCYDIRFGDLTILTIRGRNDGNALQPGSIESIAIKEYITVT